MPICIPQSVLYRERKFETRLLPIRNEEQGFVRKLRLERLTAIRRLVPGIDSKKASTAVIPSSNSIQRVSRL